MDVQHQNPRPNSSKSLDKRSMFNRPSSVIESSDPTFGSLRTTTIGSIDLHGPRPPPVPPHQAKLTPLGFPSHHESQLQLRDTKKSGHRKGFVNHVRTISDSGLKRIGMPIKSNTIDSHSNSFNHKKSFPEDRGRLIEELRVRHQEVQITEAPQHLRHDTSTNSHSGIPTSPLPPPPQYAQRSGQTVGSGNHEQPPIIQYPSLQRSSLASSTLSRPSNKMYADHHVQSSNVTHRKQHVFGDAMQIQSAQSIESLPSLSSDELSAKYSPVPVPPPRKVNVMNVMK
jgi:hypothetical protein